MYNIVEENLSNRKIYIVDFSDSFLKQIQMRNQGLFVSNMMTINFELSMYVVTRYSNIKSQLRDYQLKFHHFTVMK